MKYYSCSVKDEISHVSVFSIFIGKIKWAFFSYTYNMPFIQRCTFIHISWTNIFIKISKIFSVTENQVHKKKFRISFSYHSVINTIVVKSCHLSVQDVDSSISNLQLNKIFNHFSSLHERRYIARYLARDCKQVNQIRRSGIRSKLSLLNY